MACWEKHERNNPKCPGCNACCHGKPQPCDMPGCEGLIHTEFDGNEGDLGAHIYRCDRCPRPLRF